MSDRSSTGTVDEIPRLPRDEPEATRAEREAAIRVRRNAFDWNRGTRIAPHGFPSRLPASENFHPIWTGQVLVKLLELVENILSTSARAIEQGRFVVKDNVSAGDIESALVTLRFVQQAQADFAGLLPGLRGRGLELEWDAEDDGWLENLIEWTVNTLARLTLRGLARSLAGRRSGRGRNLALRMIEDHLRQAFAGHPPSLLRTLGLWGPASDLYAYAEQFRTVPLPDQASTVLDDRSFAYLRLTGPNPAMIRRASAPDSRFPVSEADFEASGARADDRLADAMAAGRIYTLDFAVLEGMAAGKVGSTQKYVEAAMAMFCVDPADGSFHPVAIQLGQRPGPDTPIFTPADGAAWAQARIHLSAADGTVQETISHLALTHLLIGAFKISLERTVSSLHPLYQLLSPHFQGTLAINAAAEKNLIAPGGVVDLLLGTELSASSRMAVEALSAFRVREHYLPAELESRGVADAKALPVYPYRDDALLLWPAIARWVGGYVETYYARDEDVRSDAELQAWIEEVQSPTGGMLRAVGPIDDRDQLRDLVTFIIFTASVQHSAVNFPQLSCMSITPVLPLAAYAPAPTTKDIDRPVQDAILEHLPPLEQALLQQGITQLLGGIYFTRLGDYDRNRRGSTFADDRVHPALDRFQRELHTIQFEIGRRNLERIPYTTLLPTNLPQSINI